MTLSFFDRLYDGFRAEYFVMGELFGAGYEAFKLPADFGFDVLATNQMESTLGVVPKSRTIPPPYAFQVKSRNVPRSSFGGGPTGRPQAYVDFWISEREFGRICAESGGYLVCVVTIEGEDKELSGRNIFFWLHSTHLQRLKALGYFLSLEPPPSYNLNQAYLRLRVCVRLLPTIQTRQVIDTLRKDNHLTEEGETKLLALLPERLDSTVSGSEYFSLTRASKTESKQEVVRKLPNELSSFLTLGTSVGLGSNM